MSKHMQAAKQSLSSACLDAYIAAKQQQLHGLIMSTLSMYERRTTRLGPYMLPNTPIVMGCEVRHPGPSLGVEITTFPVPN